MLPCNMVDKHTITLQLKEGNDTTSKGDSTREKEVVTVIIDVDIHASLEHRVVINTSLHRGAAQYTRVRIVFARMMLQGNNEFTFYYELINTSDSFAIPVGGERVTWVCINICS